MSIRREVFKILDSLPEGNISGWKLHEMIYFKTGRRPYPPTLLQYARDYADISGGSFDCVDPQKSVYRYVPGFGIGSARIEGRE